MQQMKEGIKMKYEGSVYRPPSEAYSLIVQITIGCSHNKCTFCSMYKDKKFRIRNIQEIREDLLEASKTYKDIRRIFLADGNALAMKTDDLKEILLYIKEIFPVCKRVGIYSAPKDILRKSHDELALLKSAGLGIAYLGVESGSDIILNDINKGVTAALMIEAGRKIMNSDIKLSTTLISGLGGKAHWKEHAIESAKVISAISPDYLGLLTLLLEPGTEMYQQVEKGQIELLTPKEIMMETYEFLKNIDVKNCIFRSNHASNYVALEGTLPDDKHKLLQQLESIVMEDSDYKSEFFRRL